VIELVVLKKKPSIIKNFKRISIEHIYIFEITHLSAQNDYIVNISKFFIIIIIINDSSCNCLSIKPRQCNVLSYKLCIKIDLYKIQSVDVLRHEMLFLSSYNYL
jgi:hypothetical protein